jgi:Fanconi-associated nuclease 1
MHQQDNNKRSSSAKAPVSPAKRQQIASGKGQRKIDLFFKKLSQPATHTTTTTTTTLSVQSQVVTTATNDIMIKDNNNKENSDAPTTPPPLHERVVNANEGTPAPTATPEAEAAQAVPTPFFETSMYTDQVHHMLTTVLDGEAFLFTASDLDRFEHFKKLPLEPQHLFVRLWMRKQRRWLRVNKLDYSSNIRDIHQAATELAKSDMVHTFGYDDYDSASALDWPDILNLLTVDELKDFAACYQCQPTDRKMVSKTDPRLSLYALF